MEAMGRGNFPKFARIEQVLADSRKCRETGIAREASRRSRKQYDNLIYYRRLRQALTNLAGVLGPFSRKFVTPMRIS